MPTKPLKKQDTKHARKRFIGAESVSVMALCLLLCGIYWLAVTLGDNYGRQLSDSEKSAAAVAAISDFVSNNSEIAAFLGLKAPRSEISIEVVKELDTDSVREKAEKYINTCNGLYSEPNIDEIRD